jgi:hypothetical protein
LMALANTFLVGISTSFEFKSYQSPLFSKGLLF